MLRGAIGSQTGSWHHAQIGRHVDDVTRSLLQHTGEHELRTVQHTAEVHPDNRIGDRIRLIDKPPSRHDARVVNQDLQRRFDAVQELRERLARPDVEA